MLTFGIGSICFNFFPFLLNSLNISFTVFKWREKKHGKPFNFSLSPYARLPSDPRPMRLLKFWKYNFQFCWLLFKAQWTFRLVNRAQCSGPNTARDWAAQSAASISDVGRRWSCLAAPGISLESVVGFK